MVLSSISSHIPAYFKPGAPEKLKGEKDGKVEGKGPDLNNSRELHTQKLGFVANALFSGPASKPLRQRVQRIGHLVSRPLAERLGRHRRARRDAIDPAILQGSNAVPSTSWP
jgi:hypothetical protein